MRAQRQTDRHTHTHTHADHNTSHPYQGEVIAHGQHTFRYESGSINEIAARGPKFMASRCPVTHASPLLIS